MSESRKVATLDDALAVLVEDLMNSYGMAPEKHPEFRNVLFQVAASTASLMAKHYVQVPDAAPAPDLAHFTGRGGGPHSVH